MTGRSSGLTAGARRLLALAALVLAVGLAVGCALPRPRGDAPLRYRDAVFSNVSVQRDLVYGSAPDNDGNPVTLRLDLYQPAGDTAGRRPAVVWIHGGGFCCGSKVDGVASALAGIYARLGYVTVSIDYRLLVSEGCGGNANPGGDCIQAAIAAQHDAQAAVRWLRSRATSLRIDPDRIAIGGSSAGAVTSLLVGMRPEDPGDSGNPGFSSAVGGVVSLAGGLPTNTWITGGDPATQFFHGTEDRTVPFDWAQSNARAMQAARVPVLLNAIEGAGHGLWPAHRDYIESQSSYFLYYTLDLDEP